MARQHQVSLAHLLRDLHRHRPRQCYSAAGFRKLLLRSIRYWSAPRRSEGHDLGSVSRRSRPSPRPLAGCRPDGSRRPQTRPRHRQMPRRSLCLRHSTQRSLHQQRVRTGAAPSNHPSQSHRLLPSRWGARLYTATVSVIATDPQQPFRPSAVRIPSPASPSLHQPQHRGEQLPKRRFTFPTG